MKSRIIAYANYIIENGINLKDGQVVEVVSSTINNDFINILTDIIKKHNSKVYITYIDGYELEDRINNNHLALLEDKINYYNELISKKYVRINLLSPFKPPMAKTKELEEYNNSLGRLAFVNDYFKANTSSHTVAAIPNMYWAAKLGISIDSLWELVISLTFSESIIQDKIDLLNNLKIKELHFSNNIGTDFKLELTKDFVFTGKKFKTIDGVEFEPNIPCLEVFTAPLKYSVTGKVVSTKPLVIKGNVINNYEIKLLDGLVVEEMNLKELLFTSPSLRYVGEIALAPYNKDYYLCTLLDENSGCHIALGNAHLNGIKEINKINSSKHHVDLVFGSSDLNVWATTIDDKKIELFKNGEFIL